jgi:proline dehydrogenase
LNALGKGLLAITDLSPVRKLFTDTRAGRALSHRFVAGETLDEAATVAKQLNADGFQVSLDHLGEHVDDRAACFDARDAYLGCLDRIGSDGLDANISVKLSHLGLALDETLATDSLAQLAARAGEVGTTVTVDMEESEYTESTITAYEEVQAESGNLGIAVQSYLYRTDADLDRIVPLGGHIRLCKGAYAEPESVAYQSMARVDAAFDALTRRLMAEPGLMPAIASHDLARIELVQQLASTRQGPWEFQMLYGVRRDLQARLIAEGHPVRIYLPYGSAWYPYLTRRMAERPANLGFFLRAAAGK